MSAHYFNLNLTRFSVDNCEKAITDRHRLLYAQPDVHLIRRPTDGRPFLLATKDPQHLAKRIRYWSWLHGVISVIAFGFIAVQFGRQGRLKKFKS